VAYLDQGGTVVVVDRFGDTMDPGVRDELLARPAVSRALMEDVDELQPAGLQVELDDGVGVNMMTLSDGVAVHLVNFDYDRRADAVRPRKDVRLAVRLPGEAGAASFVDSRGGTVELTVETIEGRRVVHIPELGVYGIVVFRPANPEQKEASA
jgi:hypothetical protein